MVKQAWPAAHPDEGVSEPFGCDSNGWPVAKRPGRYQAPGELQEVNTPYMKFRHRRVCSAGYYSPAHIPFLPRGGVFAALPTI